MTGIEMIVAERKRQIDVERWTPEHDDKHRANELVDAAVWFAAHSCGHPHQGTVRVYIPASSATGGGHDGSCGRAAYSGPAYPIWPWDGDDLDKRHKHGRIRSLTIAGALIAAEIDRLQRVKA